jgi:hypothetical protein
MSKTRIEIPGKELIQFEGTTLPEGAKYFEAASFYTSLPEDIKDWVCAPQQALTLVGALLRIDHSACDASEDTT